MAGVEDYIDPTTGQRNYRKGKDTLVSPTLDLSNIKDERIRKHAENMSNRGYVGLYNPAEFSMEQTPNPVEYIGDRVGKSSYDKNISSMEDVENIDQFRHEEQPWYSSLGAAVVQTGTTLAGQTLQGIGYLTDIEQIGNILTGRETEFNNFLAQAGTDLIAAGEDIAPIYQDPSKEGQVNLGDWTYWAANAPSIISTLSMMLPGMAVAGALGKIGAISKMGALAQWGIKGAAGALTSRYIEASMEAAPLVKQFEDLVGQQLTMSQAQQIKKEYGIDIPGSYDPETGSIGFYITPELAKEAGGKAAAKNFTNNMALIATDLPQFLVATAPFGSISKAVTKTMAKTLGKEFMPILAKKGASTAFQMTTEGAEEGYQYITSEDAKNVELARMGLIEKSELSDRVAKYVTNGEFTTSAIFGALGAGVMMGGMKGINKLKAMKNGGQSEDELRLENAESWSGTVNAYTEALKKAETSGDEKEYNRVHNEYLTSLGIKAAANQNFDALVDFIEAGKSGEVKDVEELGFDENTAKHLKENGDKIIEKLKTTGKIFQQNLNETGGNRTQAEILTLADVKVDNYTDALRQSASDVNKIINDDKNWVPANGQTNIPVPTRLKDATRLDEEAIHWNNKLAENTIALTEAESKVGTGKESFVVNELKRKNELIKSNLDRVAKERESLNYTKEEHTADLNLFSLKQTVKNDVSNAVKEKTTNEYELADNLHASKFYRTEEGKALLNKQRYKVSKNEVVNAVKSVIEKDKETPQSPLDLINQMREADGVGLSSQVNSVVNENVSNPKVDVGDSVNLNEIEQQIKSDKNIAIKEQERLAKEDRRLNNSVSILNAIDKLKVSKQTVLEDAQSLEDTVSYLHELLYQVGDLSFDNVSSIEKQIKELNKIISSKSSKLTRHGNLAGKKIELLKENIKDEFTLLNDLTNRIQYLKEQIAQLEEISRDLDNQMNYYHNLIADKSFETLNKEELSNRINSIKRKQSVLERLISNLKKSIEKSIEIISHYVKYTVDSIKRLTKFETETSFKRLTVTEIQDAIRNNDNSIDDYSQLSQEYDKLEAEVSSLISDTELVEEARVNEDKHIQELQNKLRVYDNQIRYIEELINGDLSLIEKEGIVFNDNLDKDTVESVVEQSIPEPVVKRRPGRPKKNPEKAVIPKVKSGKPNKKNTATNEVVAPEQEVAPEVVYPEDSIDNGLFNDETYFDDTLEPVESQESLNAKEKFKTTFDNNYGENALVNLATDMFKFMKDNPQFKDEIEANLSSVESFKSFVMQIIQESIDNDNESAKELRTKLAQFYSDKNKVVAQTQANSESTLEQTTKKDNIITRLANKLFIKFANRGNNTSIVPTMYTNPDLLNQKLLNQFGIKENEPIQIALHSKDSYANQDAAARKYVLFVERGGKKIIIGNLPTSNQSGTNEEKAILKKLREDLFEYFKDSKNITGDVSVYKVNGNPLTTKIAGYTGEYSIDIKEVNGVDKVQRHSPNTNKLVKPKEPNSTLGKLMSNAGGFILGAVTNSNGTGIIEWGKDKTIPNVGEIKINKLDDSRVKLSNTLTQTSNNEVVVTYIKPHDVSKATKRAKELGVSYEQYVIPTYGEQRGYNIEEYGSEAEATTSAKEWLKEQYDLESKGSLFVAIPNPAAPWDILNIRAFYTPLSELQGKPKETLLKAINERIERSVNANDLIKNLKEIIYINKNSESLINKALTGVKSFNEVKDILTGKAESTEYGIIKSIINNARINANVEMFNAESGVGNWKHSFIENDGTKTYNQAVGDYMYFTINPSEPLTNVSPIIDLDAFNQTSKPQPQKVTKPVDVAITPAKPIIPTVSESVVNNPVVLEKAQEAVVEEVKPTEQSTKSFSIDMSIVDELLNITEISDKVEQPVDADKQSDNDEVVAKLSQSNETVVKDSKEEIEWFKKYFPNISIGELEDIKDMVRNITEHGHTAWAAYHNAAIWLRDKMPEGTVYHEAFHVIYNLALTPKERNQLLAQAEGNTVLEKEEWLADKFKSILLTNKPDVATKGFIAKIFRKLKQLLNSIWSNKNGLTLHELANRVEQGKYTKLRTDKFNDPTLRLYREVAGWDYRKSKVATDAINKYIVSDLLPHLRKVYPKMAGMNDADTMNSYIKANNDAFALHRIVAEMLRKKAETMTGVKKDNLLDLVSKMFINEQQQPLIMYSLDALGINQGIVVKINGANNKSISIEKYMESVDDETSKAEVYDVNFITKSSKNDAPSRVKNVLRYLMTGETNIFGLPEYYNYDETYNTILRKASGITSVKELENILEKNVENYPQYRQLLDKIAKDKEFGTLMFQAFNRANMSFHYIYGRDGNISIEDANKSKAASTLYDSWEYNFNNIPSNFFNDNVSGANGKKLLVKYNEIVNNFTDGTASLDEIKEMSKLLSSIGLDVKVDNLVYLQNNLSNTDLNDLFKNPYKSIKVIFNSLATAKNPFKTDETVSKGQNNAVGSVRNLAKLVANSSPDMFETSHISISGEKVYSQIIPQFLTNLIHDLHDPELVIDKLDKYSRDPLFATGRTIRKFDESTEEPFNLVVDLENVKFNNPILDKIAKIFMASKYESITIPGALERNLAKADAIRTELENVIQVGFTEGSSISGTKTVYSEMEDQDLKAASMHMFWNKNNKIKSLFRMPPMSDSPNMVDLTVDRLSREEAIEAIIRIGNGEYNRIQSIKNNTSGIEIIGYDNAYNSSTDTGYHIATMFNGFKENPIDNKEKATKVIEEAYKNEAIKYIQKLVKYKAVVFNGNIIDTKKSKLSKDMLNYVSDKAGLLKYVTDMLMNHTVSVSALSTLSIGDPAFYYDKKTNSVAVNYIKRAKEIISPKSLPNTASEYTVRNEDGSVRETIRSKKEYNSIYIKDVKIEAPSMTNIKAFVDSQVEANIISREVGDNLIEQYKTVNHTDAQAFITLPFYRETMHTHGLWNDDKQRAYDKLIIGKGTVKDLVVLQPIKPFMFNQKFNPKRGVMVPNQHKNSEFILMPQLVNENPKLNAIYEYMINKHIDVANFNSAVKVGEYDSIGFDELVDGTQLPTIHKIDMLQRGIQQETPEHHIGATGKVNVGLQVNCIANLRMTDDNGNLIDYYVKDRKYNANELVEHYLNLIEENLRSSYEDKFRPEFLTNDELDWEKVSNILKLAAEGEQLPQDFVDAISYDRNTGKIKLPPFDPLFGAKMEAIFFAMTRNGITKQTANQASTIQLSSVGLADDLKLVFHDGYREKFDKDLADSNNIITFAKLNDDVRKSIELKGYNEEMWNTLTETEKEHAIKCATV